MNVIGQRSASDATIAELDDLTCTAARRYQCDHTIAHHNTGSTRLALSQHRGEPGLQADWLCYDVDAEGKVTSLAGGSTRAAVPT